MKLRVTCIALLAAIGCGSSRPDASRPSTSNGGDEGDDDDTTQELARDLKGTILENYRQLTLGNLEAYVDGISHEHDLTLVGLGPGDVIVGVRKLKPSQHNRPYKDDIGVRLYSKNLSVHLSNDRSVGWMSDEVSYRVPYRVVEDNEVVFERTASIPIRASAVYVRDIDRWVLVAEHLSYPLPIRDVIESANEWKPPHELPDDPKRVNDTTLDAVVATVKRFHSKDDSVRLSTIAQGARGQVLFPDPDDEYVNGAALTSESLQYRFGTSVEISLVDSRVSERVGNIVWMLANLNVTFGEAGDKKTVRLRGTYTLEATRGDPETWHIVQAHVSVPITRKQLDKRVFGKDS